MIMHNVTHTMGHSTRGFVVRTLSAEPQGDFTGGTDKNGMLSKIGSIMVKN